jgi:hypothetical protein
MLNIMNTDTQYDQYLSFFENTNVFGVLNKHLLFKLWFVILWHYATFLRLRRECHIRNLPEQNRNLHQSLSKSDAI